MFEWLRRLWPLRRHDENELLDIARAEARREDILARQRRLEIQRDLIMRGRPSR